MTLDVFECHKDSGALDIVAKLPISTPQELGVAYTPGIAKLCSAIEKRPELADQYTMKGKLVAVITDGTAVLGLGNIGPQAGLPVVEGKALLANKLAGITAIPLCIEAKSVDEQVKTIENIAKSFSAIHLEDIKSPECFELERKLQERIDIPVHHDDQDGTAIAVLAGLINACKITKKDLKSLKIVICGAGASGIATGQLLYEYGIKNILMVDKQGILHPDLTNMNREQKRISQITNSIRIKGSLQDALIKADVFIGLSVGDILNIQDIKSMAKEPIVFALANPIPEINPSYAEEGGAAIVATGSKQYPNQINNVLVFPGLFRGLLQSRQRTISIKTKVNIAKAIAALVEKPTKNYIIPDIFDERVVPTVALTVINSDKTSE